ncbi:MAG TPA: coenzyme F420-0:L-glutamate ligase [Candidatus Acidoferrales bacterium]|nr:coenzyme F420-0:L-glutamate ligase [Candidatus Acidoferrales bacterium]
MAEPIRMFGLGGLDEIQPQDDLGALVAAAARAAGVKVGAGDLFVVAQKVVSKAEGRIVPLETVTPSPMACRWAEQWGKDARAVEVALWESRRIVRMDRGILITETRHGFVCANAGVDSSNAPPGCVTLLPVDCDRSAAALRERLESEFRTTLGVIISDSFGRPWREGLVNVALGVAGVQALADCRGQKDSFGRSLQVTVIAVADELAAAAELVMGKTRRVPVVVIQGFALGGAGTGRELVRAAEADLFR